MSNRTHEGYLYEDLINLLGEEDGNWFIKGCPIPYANGNHLWSKCRDISDKVKLANLTVHEASEYKAPRINVMSDSLGSGVQGLVNPVNGQKYDSKSEYYKAVKAAGCEVMGNDAPTQKATPKTESIDWKQAVAETIQQSKNSPTKKGKKK